MEIILGQNIKIKQVTVLAFSIVISAVFFSAALYSQNEYYFFISIAVVIFLLGVNWLYSKVYEVRINEVIICGNLYRTVIFDIRQFDSIVASKKWIPPFILFPFPSPPYFVFKLKNNKGYLFMDTSHKAFFSMFNIEKHIKNLNSKVDAVLTASGSQ